MSDEARDLRTKQLSRATERLREALAEVETTPLALDAAIQRFEFSYELAWKALRAHLLVDRNRTSHTYEEALAREIGRRLPSYLDRLVDLARLLSERLVSARA